jgi:SAM-dependent methyltransferase
MAPSSGASLIDFYAAEYAESERLLRANNRLELLRTQKLLRARLGGAPARILDVGGGTGVHAAWLAADGHRVELVDLVPTHVQQAREVSSKLATPFAANVGDARALEAEDETFDVSLLLGPLYHLPDPADQALALAEAVRVTRPGGLVVAAVISRYAWPLYELRDAITPDLERTAAIAEILKTGRAPTGPTTTSQEQHLVSHTPEELRGAFMGAGLVDVSVLGLEGPGWLLFASSLAEEAVEGLLAASLAAAEQLDGYPETAPSSAHFMAFGRVRSNE